MDKHHLHKLVINEDSDGFGLELDGMKLHHVEEYKVTKSSEIKGTAELTVKMLVEYQQEETKMDEKEYLSFPERHPYIPMIISIIALIAAYTR